MAIKRRRAPFNPKTFLARVGAGRSMATYRKSEVVFSQGDLANEVFYIQKGKVVHRLIDLHLRGPLLHCSISITMY